jgi:radical SAM superfamily enzyme YgiQ (UPF0313 family)
MSVRLLLINPKYPESFWSFSWAVREVLPGKRAINPPLGLATLAALCPPDWQVTIVDENIESVPLAPEADVIGVCGMGVQFLRQAELLAYYRSKGYPAIAGGSYASLCPEKYADIADVVVAGEAENIWKQFCRDYLAGTPAKLYRETAVVALEDSPTPRFDLLHLERYTTATLQFSRGCPYMCDFCDIIVMFGRKPRCKSIAQVERELDALRTAGARSVFFVDDNLIGNRPAAKRLLVFLHEYQRRHGNPFRFGTEVSLNIAADGELLQGFRDAGFVWVFIGIETPDEDSLRETRKLQNMKQDILASVRRIYAYGIDVLAGFIIGFDNDTADTFEKQRRFIMQSGIQAAMVGLLTALPRTPLYDRLKREGRLIERTTGNDNTSLATNVMPKNMPYEEIIERYRGLYQQLLTDAGIAERVRNKMRYMRSPVYDGEYTRSEQALILWRLLTKGLLPGGFRRLFHFARTLPLLRPGRFPLVVVDWIGGLAMRDYVERRLLPLASKPRPHVSLSLQLPVGRRFFRRTGRQLERLLADSSTTLTLTIEYFAERERAHLEQFLQRLARYGDRVWIVLHERVRSVVRVDSSVFHLVLMPPGG